MTRPRFRPVPPEQLDVEDAVAAARAIQDDPAPAALPWHGIPHTAELDEALGHARGAWAATPVGPYTYRVQDADGNDLVYDVYFVGLVMSVL